MNFAANKTLVGYSFDLGDLIKIINIIYVKVDGYLNSARQEKQERESAGTSICQIITLLPGHV